MRRTAPGKLSDRRGMGAVPSDTAKQDLDRVWHRTGQQLVDTSIALERTVGHMAQQGTAIELLNSFGRLR